MNTVPSVAVQTYVPESVALIPVMMSRPSALARVRSSESCAPSPRPQLTLTPPSLPLKRELDLQKRTVMNHKELP